MKPTAEQAAAIEAFSTLGSLKIIAGAGTGKTTTLKLLSSSTTRKGQYLAFNRAMADDAKTRMPNNVSVSTAHSLAFRGTRGAYKHKVDSRMTARQAAEIAGIHANGISLSAGSNPLDLYQTTVGYFLLDWVRAFCNSDADDISLDNMPYRRPLQWVGADPEALTPEDFRAARNLAEQLLPKAQRLWESMSNPNNAVPATHDVYLKVWVMSRPRLATDFILFDEAQDANPLMLQLVNAQTHAQRVFVGDPYQQIYSWRGAVNAMQTVQTDRETTLSESFRFGPHIAEFANLVLSRFCGSTMRLSGKADLSRPVDQVPQAIICRTNAAIVSALLKLPDLRRAYVAGGTAEIVSLLRGMEELRDRNRTQQPDLAHFQSWNELLDHAKEAGDDLASLLRITQQGENIAPLIDTLSRTAKDSDGAHVVLSTGHKCKGLEWAAVDLDDDFLPKDRSQLDSVLRGERANLLYVAGTRAQRHLELGGRFEEMIDGCQPCYEETPPKPMRKAA